MSEQRLDRWLPKPAIRTHHRRASFCEADHLWRAALSVELGDTGMLGRLIRWRIPGTRSHQSFAELFRSYPFTVLEETDGLLISGLCGRIWTLARDYPELADATAFRSWNEAGTVRVMFAHWTQPVDGDRFELVSEARIAPVDRSAEVRLRALWAMIGGFERLVGSEALKVAVSRAEAEAGRGDRDLARGPRAARWSR